MRIYKTKPFSRWAQKQGLMDSALRVAVEEIEAGDRAASLGGYLYKKRVALAGRGKSGGARVILAYRNDGCAFCLYGFAKNTKANITPSEEKSLKLITTHLFGLSDAAITRALLACELIEVVTQNE